MSARAGVLGSLRTTLEMIKFSHTLFALPFALYSAFLAAGGWPEAATLGKILLAQGSTAEAIEHLEAATRLTPGEANTHYQLGRAYTRVGRAEEAQQQFEISRQIKAKR